MRSEPKCQDTFLVNHRYVGTFNFSLIFWGIQFSISSRDNAVFTAWLSEAQKQLEGGKDNFLAHLVLLPRAWLEKKCPHVLLKVCSGFVLGSLPVLKKML